MLLSIEEKRGGCEEECVPPPGDNRRKEVSCGNKKMQNGIKPTRKTSKKKGGEPKVAGSPIVAY
ncbi:hypothetical protein BTA51_29625 [Hahella sp. CCB-MM4]|nr:hypothetical protein BTA51_29625 [Hahella sp. CCB-MM4]